jgi:multidrug ABC transporter, permease/ATP-binding protein
MFKMIRQFTFHNPKEIIQPTVWLFLSQACSMLPAILAYMAIYMLGQAFVPPYTLDLQLLIILTAIGLGYVLLQYAVELVSYYFTYGRAYSDTAKKRVAYIQKLRRQPLGFFSSKESGELISSFSNDFSNVEYTLCYWLPYPIGVGILLVISIVWISIYDWRMGIAMFGMLPVCAALMFGIARIKEKHSRQVMEAKTHAATQINEYLHGMKDLKAYHRTGDGFHSLETALSKLRDESLKEESVAGSLSTLCSSLVKFIVPVTAAIGLYLLIGGTLSVLDLAGFLVLATKLVEAELMIVISISSLRGMIPSGERLDKVMTTDEPSGTEQIEIGNAYSFEKVSFHYTKNREIIQSVSFDTPPGLLTALVGPSGGGKSTLLRLMARFWDYQTGHIRMDGRDIKEIQPDSLLSNISMVMQNAYLFRGTIRENLCFGDESITEEQMTEACRQARCHDFISALPEGYDTVVGEGGATLSGGERQRISLARAFLKDVPILLLDEPTASLDADNEAMVQKALDAISKERTVVMIAHRLKTVRGADQILVLQDGKIVQKGTHNQLAGQKGLYARLWGLQSQAGNYTFKQSEEENQ